MTTVQTSALVDDLLKRVYDSEIENQVNLERPVLEFCAREGSARLGGEGFFGAARTRAPEGHRYITETADLPAGGQSKVPQWNVSPSIQAGVIELSGLSMAVSSGDVMAFASAFDENVEETISAMSAYREGALFRDGTGALATFDGNPSDTTSATTLSDVAHLREGMKVDVFRGTNRQVDSATVETVDWVNREATFDSDFSGSVQDGDTIYLEDTQTNGSAISTVEPVGFQASLEDTTNTYLGIDRSTESNWRPNVLQAATFLDEKLVLRSRTRVIQESGLSAANINQNFGILTHPSQADVLFELAIPRIQFSGGSSIDLGYSDLKFAGMPVKVTYNCPRDKAYLGDWSKSRTLYTSNGKLHLDNEYNGSVFKWVATKDVGLVFAKSYHAFVVKRPNCFVAITNLSTPDR